MSIENDGAGSEDDIDLQDLPDGDKDKDGKAIDWKKLAQERQGIAQRYKTKAEKAKIKPAEVIPAKKEEGATPKAGELDRMDKQILRMEKITSESEIGLVTAIMKDTGKTLDQVLESKYFQAELKELRETEATKQAMPDGKSRSGQSARDTVDYWIAKGELPPEDQQALRRQVVKAKIAKEKSGNKFTKNSVI